MEIKRILVPLDFSEFSNKALEFTLALATKGKTTISLLHVVVLFQDDIDEEERLQQYEELTKTREENVKNQMESSKKKVKRKGVTVESIIVRGISAADTILEYIDSSSFDLIVMGTHGRTGLKHLLLGSVSEKIVRLSAISVLTVHRSIKNFHIKKVLVPIDFSVHSKEAADHAILVATEFKAKIQFIHVIEQDIHPSFYASGIDSIFQIDTDLKDRVIQNLKEFLADQLNPSLQYTFIVKEGKAHKEIVETAKDLKSDMIVIATHGLSGLDYFLLGSTAEKVVRWANCPVLTVKRAK
jgi:nucleotide-binding universal stress UspA family protein